MSFFARGPHVWAQVRRLLHSILPALLLANLFILASPGSSHALFSIRDELMYCLHDGPSHNRIVRCDIGFVIEYSATDPRTGAVNFRINDQGSMPGMEAAAGGAQLYSNGVLNGYLAMECPPGEIAPAFEQVDCSIGDSETVLNDGDAIRVVVSLEIPKEAVANRETLEILIHVQGSGGRDVLLRADNPRVPNLHVRKELQDECVNLGAGWECRYRVTVENRSNADFEGDIELVEQLHGNSQLLAVVNPPDENWECEPRRRRNVRIRCRRTNILLTLNEQTIFDLSVYHPNTQSVEEMLQGTCIELDPERHADDPQGITYSDTNRACGHRHPRVPFALEMENRLVECLPDGPNFICQFAFAVRHSGTRYEGPIQVDSMWWRGDLIRFGDPDHRGWSCSPPHHEGLCTLFYVTLQHQPHGPERARLTAEFEFPAADLDDPFPPMVCARIRGLGNWPGIGELVCAEAALGGAKSRQAQSGDKRAFICRKGWTLYKERSDIPKGHSRYALVAKNKPAAWCGTSPLTCDAGEDAYFRQSEIRKGSDWRKLTRGGLVLFCVKPTGSPVKFKRGPLVKPTTAPKTGKGKR